MKNFKNGLFAYLVAKININKIDELTNFWPITWLKKWFIQRIINYEFPQHIFIETTSACNLKCKICPRSQKITPVGHMDFELFKKAVDEAKIYGPRNFSLHLSGEPLLAPNFVQEIFYIKKSCPQNTIFLTTNGTTLNEKIARALIKARVDKIAVSFISTTREKYAEYTGVDKLETAEENIKHLTSLKKELKSLTPKIIIRLMIDDFNKDEAEPFQKKWQGQAMVVEVRLIHNFGGNVAYGETRGKDKKRWPCYHPWLSPAIHWNGDFSLCCNDYKRQAVIGNIKNQTIHEIWSSKTMRNFRQQQLKGSFSVPLICKNCNVWTTYQDIFFGFQKK